MKYIIRRYADKRVQEDYAKHLFQAIRIKRRLKTKSRIRIVA